MKKLFCLFLFLATSSVYSMAAAYLHYNPVLMIDNQGMVFKPLFVGILDTDSSSEERLRHTRECRGGIIKAVKSYRTNNGEINLKVYNLELCETINEFEHRLLSGAYKIVQNNNSPTLDHLKTLIYAQKQFNIEQLDDLHELIRYYYN